MACTKAKNTNTGRRSTAYKEKLDLLTRVPESAIERDALTLLNLHDSWEWATHKERKMLVRTMIQEAGCDVGTKRTVWVKVNPAYEILFRLIDGLRPDTERRYWICEQGTEVDIVDMGEELGKIATGVKIAFPVSYSLNNNTVSHNTLTSVEEYAQ